VYDKGAFSDDGTRPLPQNAATPVFYQCPGILIDGAPYAGQVLMPGTEYQLSAKVRNRGGLEGTATVRFYPSEPATGLNPARLLPGSTPFIVPSGATLTSPAVTFIPAFDEPSHLCLFAEVTAPLDPPGGSGSPAKDRHYAQQNVQVQKVRRGQHLVIPFSAVGGIRRGKYLVAIRQIDDAEHQGTPRVALPAGSLRLTDPRGGAGDGQQRVAVELDRWEQRPFSAEVSIPQEAQNGAFARLVIDQTPIDAQDAGATGAIAITLELTN
jgi:hypothetical protein